MCCTVHQKKIHTCRSPVFKLIYGSRTFRYFLVKYSVARGGGGPSTVCDNKLRY